MTLPVDIILPLQTELIRSGDPAKLELYIRNLVESLTDMYIDLAQNVNGSVQSWTPEVMGLTSSGTGTYVNQYGWYRRAGIITELWFDVSWTAHTGSGNTALRLPYLAAKSSGKPWVGVIESTSASNNFGAYTYLVINCEPNTTEGRIIRCGSGLASSGLVIGDCKGFRGYVQYIGQELENT